MYRKYIYMCDEYKYIRQELSAQQKLENKINLHFVFKLIVSNYKVLSFLLSLSGTEHRAKNNIWRNRKNY